MDEKWFYTTRLREKLKYLPDHEFRNQHTTQHKSHIPRLMVTSAISQPTDTFDGKCGLIYHGEIRPAQNNSANRPRGTLELHSKNVDHDGQLKEDGIINQIIEKKYPETWTTIQMNNAPGHVGYDTINNLNNILEIENVYIGYHTQPSQRPDFNINDLCFFNSLQKQSDRLRRSVGQVNNTNLLNLYNNVKTAYDKYPKETIAIGYGHLFACFNETIRLNGENRYKNPHMKVRQRFYRHEALNIVNINIDRYYEIKHSVNNYFR